MRVVKGQTRLVGHGEGGVDFLQEVHLGDEGELGLVVGSGGGEGAAPWRVAVVFLDLGAVASGLDEPVFHHFGEKGNEGDDGGGEEFDRGGVD